MDRIWAAARHLGAWATNSDFNLNLSTELIGVLLSIPLSVFIAAGLDRAAERRRMRRALQSVLLESHDQLNYLLTEMPKTLAKNLAEGASPLYLHRVLAESVSIAEETARVAVANARTTFGDRLTPELRQYLPRLIFHWGRLKRKLSFEDAYFLVLANEGATNAALVEEIEESVRDIIRSISRRMKGISEEAPSLKRLAVSAQEVDEAMKDLKPVLDAAITGWRQARGMSGHRGVDEG